MQEGSKLGGLTTSGVRSPGSYTYQGRDAKGGTAVCLLEWEAWRQQLKGALGVQPVLSF